jgi:hypothetical protein
MSIKKNEKIEKLCNGFSLLDEEDQEYIFGVLQALFFAKQKINENDEFSYLTNGENNVYTVGKPTYVYGRALIDIKSGKVYDFNGYSNIQFVSNDLLFTLEGGTVYKIDLNTVSAAIPLNNAIYNPIERIDPPVVFGKKIIGSGDPGYVYDVNRGTPPPTIERILYNTRYVAVFERRRSYANQVFIRGLRWSYYHRPGRFIVVFCDRKKAVL